MTEKNNGSAIWTNLSAVIVPFAAAGGIILFTLAIWAYMSTAIADRITSHEATMHPATEKRLDEIRSDIRTHTHNTPHHAGAAPKEDLRGLERAIIEIQRNQSLILLELERVKKDIKR
jgi:hypothetical protein